MSVSDIKNKNIYNNSNSNSNFSQKSDNTKKMASKLSMPKIKINPIKVFIVSLVNIFATNEGRFLLRSVIKLMEPTVKIFLEELIRNIDKNKPLLIRSINAFLKPAVSAVIDTLRSIPAAGEVLSGVIAIRNLLLAVINGSNLFSASVDNLITSPLKELLKQTHVSYVNLKDLDKERRESVISLLKLIEQYNMKKIEIEEGMRNGVDIKKFLNNKNVGAALNNVSNEITNGANNAFEKTNMVSNNINQTISNVSSTPKNSVSNNINSNIGTVTNTGTITGGNHRKTIKKCKKIIKNKIKNCTKRINSTVSMFNTTTNF